ncbi:hypothetical protein LTR85_012199 [Meristemomyces frigidus]|nr:hypothetical protein LTR85_012199 [Meristemomyces frigidus]
MANCNDRAKVLADIPNFVWPAGANPALITNPLNVPACMTVGLRRCKSTRTANHRNALPGGGYGPVIKPFMVCNTCEWQSTMMHNHSRRRATSANPGFRIRGTDALIEGPLGAHTRGRLCNHCTAQEIEAYYNRRYVNGRTKTPDQASSTCKCTKELGKWLCYTDRKDLMKRIQADTDSNAGQGGWLEHIEWVPAIRGAFWHPIPAPLLARRAAAGRCRNPCRCGRDIPRPAAPLAVPTPVAMCTACSGVIVDVAHNRVINWQANPIWPVGYHAQLTLENNLELGREM